MSAEEKVVDPGPSNENQGDPEVPDGEKLRILALHGYRQNAERFISQTEPFRNIINPWCEFVFITAPHKVLLVDDPDNPNIGEPIDDNQFGWFFNRENKTNRGTRKGGPALGYEETLRIIEEIFENAGPFDGVWGFSQGACLTGLLCDLQKRGLIKAKFNFAIIVSGFKSRCLPHMKYYSDIIELPSMHVIGEKDNIIPNEMSEELIESFEEPVIVKHPGGHTVPGSSSEEEDYKNFIKNQYMIKNYGIICDT